ncbi:MAG: formylglycine-generating enzyme family protein [Chitinophagales bacterium]|nr:formylglycine-generating enzyme family protein [Chitinophagales bacterium]
MKNWLVILTVIAAGTFANAQVSDQAMMATIRGGTYVPLYSLDTAATIVKPFMLDVYPVTNLQFLEFVKKNESWQKGKVKQLFADSSYLRHWDGALLFGKDSVKLAHAPVVNVSWYAAKAYCECYGKRLPTVAEWEFAALANETKPNASADSGFYQRIIDWYAKPSHNRALKNIGSTFKNYYGVWDMHGLVWEWTQDFNSALTSGESRSDSSLDKDLFCGAGAVNAKNLKNYAAFMRYAMRSSLKAKYSVGNLGFRCAKDVHTP